MLVSSFILLSFTSKKKDNRNGASMFLLITLALGIAFIVLQFKGFGQSN